MTKAQNFAIKSILYAEKGVNCTRPEGFQYSSTTHLAESVVDSREPLRWLLQGLILNGTVDERLTALSEQDKDAAKQNIKKIKEYYSKALEVAHDLNDKPAMKSIRKAMETLRQKV